MNEANMSEPRKLVGCDQESWIKSRIQTAIRMALAVKREHHVRADDDLMDGALDGIANGTAVEIIHILGMEPEWINLRRTRHYPEESKAKP